MVMDRGSSEIVVPMAVENYWSLVLPRKMAVAHESYPNLAKNYLYLVASILDFVLVGFARGRLAVEGRERPLSVVEENLGVRVLLLV